MVGTKGLAQVTKCAPLPIGQAFKHMSLSMGAILSQIITVSITEHSGKKRLVRVINEQRRNKMKSTRIFYPVDTEYTFSQQSLEPSIDHILGHKSSLVKKKSK